MEEADGLSRLYENKDKKANEIAKIRIKNERLAEHLSIGNGIDIWTFDDGRKRIIPKIGDRVGLIRKAHEAVKH